MTSENPESEPLPRRLPFMTRRRRQAFNSALLEKAVAIAVTPSKLQHLPERERSLVEAAAQAMQKASGAMVPALGKRPPSLSHQLSQTRGGGPPNPVKPVSVADLARNAAAALRPSMSITPAEIEVELRRQGIEWTEPFAPGRPLSPYYGYSRRPRQWDYGVGRNITTDTRPERLPFTVLKQVVENYDLAGICVRHIINDLRSMRLEFSPMEDYQGDVNKEIQIAKQFLRRPDGKRHFNTWLAMFLMDVLRFDAGCLAKERNRAGKLVRLPVISGSTVAPIVDYYGDIPDPPAPAYQQFVQGIPWDWLSSDDVVYEPQWPFPESPYGAAPIEVCMLNANCYSDDTEVLTRRGWLPFSEVDTRVDQFATRHPGTAEFQWQSASKYHVAPSDGFMYHARSKNVDILVTGGHRMLVDHKPRGCPGERHGDHWLVQAEDLYLHQEMSHRVRPVQCPATSKWDAPDLAWFDLPTHAGDYVEMSSSVVRAARGEESALATVSRTQTISRPTLRRAEQGQRLRRGSAEAICALYDLPASVISETPHYFSERIAGDDFAAFMGMWLSEGSVRPDSCNINIAQEERSKGFGEFQALLRRILGRDAPRHRSGFTFGHTSLATYLRKFGKAHEKYIPAEVLGMSQRQLRIFWHFYVLGDGITSPSGTNQTVTTASKAMADGLQEVLQKIGLSGAVRRKGSPAKESHNQQWVVQSRVSQSFALRMERVSYDRKVYCVSVPNKTLYVRRNGVPAWCANTDVRLQMFFLGFFTDGVVPEMLATAPEGMTDSDSIAELQEIWDDWYQSNQTGRHGLRWLPAGAKPFPYKPDKMDPIFAEYVMRRTVAAFGLVPDDLGFTTTVNRATADTQVDVQFRITTLPNTEYVEGILNSVIQEDLQLPVAVHFDTGREKEDRLIEAQAQQLYVMMGAKSPDEVRTGILGLPVDNANPVPRFVESPRLGPIPLQWIQSVSGPLDPNTLSPSEVPPAIPYVPLQGIREDLPDEEAPAETGPKPRPGFTNPETGRSEIHETDDMHTGHERFQQAPGNRSGSAPARRPAVGNPSGPMAKATGGITAASGLAGEDLHGGGMNPGGDEDDELEELQKELLRWRENTRSRLARGQTPRYFTSRRLPAAARDSIWVAIQGVPDRAAADAIFAKALDVIGHAKSKDAPVGGLALRARDSGRVLMLQRSLGDGKKASDGKWEFPGGHCRPGETQRQAAIREWEEEIGVRMPSSVRATGTWTAPNGYMGHVYEVDSEDDLQLDGREEVKNSDGDDFEAVAWANPQHLAGRSDLRPELIAHLGQVLGALQPEVTA